MTTTRSTALFVLVAIIGLTVAPAASGAVVGVLADDGGDDAPESETGTSVSTFMQSSAADTESTVEAGMFEAKYGAADNDSQADLVLERTNDLEGQLGELEAEREALSEREDELHRGEYQARMTRLTVKIQALNRSAERTEHRAEKVGVDTERLAELRANASELEGPEVAEIARGLAGSSGTPGDGTSAEPGNQSSSTTQSQENAGPPAHATSSGNGSANGSIPEQASENSSSSVGGADNGQGNDSSPGQASENGPDSERGPDPGSANNSSSGQENEGGPENNSNAEPGSDRGIGQGSDIDPTNDSSDASGAGSPDNDSTD
ncbi:hypothetical protein [Natronorubrum halophilum]|uniref:hypothetical protein n=1 Tax=Natronorubrum halophilum TaxID=1702106 RepID=UPI0013CEC28A|nr:hypothetical protein [Natronorubrum halophilum]